VLLGFCDIHTPFPSARRMDPRHVILEAQQPGCGRIRVVMCGILAAWPAGYRRRGLRRKQGGKDVAGDEKRKSPKKKIDKIFPNQFEKPTASGAGSFPALLPPPVPYRLFVAEGALKYSPKKFLLASGPGPGPFVILAMAYWDRC